MPTPVTDSALLAQLNQAAPVTDPDLIARLEAAPEATEPITQATPFGGEAAAAPEGDVGAMYGHDAKGAVTSFANKFIGDIPVVGPPLEGGIQRAAAGLRSLTSGDSYAEELKKVQGNVEQKEAEHPVAGAIGSVAGNVTALAPVAAAAPAWFGLDQGANLATNVARAGLTGGALMGTTAAEEGKSPTDVATQTGIGAATFGAVPVVGASVGKLVSKFVDKAASLNSPLSNEDQRALGWAVSGLEADGITTDADVDKIYNELGPHAFLAEFGPNMSGFANGANALQGEAKNIITGAINARASGVRDPATGMLDPNTGARGRIENAVTEAMGPRVNINNLTEQGITDRSDASRDLWNQFRSTQVFPTQPVKDLIAGSGEGMQRVPGLQELGLLSDAQSLAQLESAATGRPMAPMQNFFTTGERKDWPTTQSFQYIKQAIDKRIGNSYNDLGQPTQETRFYTQMKKRLDDTIKQANPDAAKVWMQAREAWGNPTEIMNARREGQQAFQRGTRRDDMIAQLSDYSGPERAAYKQGARDSIAEDMDATINGDTTARNRLLAPANQDKLNYLATRNGYNSQTLIDKLQQEKSMGDFKNYVLGGSKTGATEASKAALTPNPEELAIVRARTAYLPHVQAGPYIIPKALENAAIARQAGNFGESTKALAPMLMKQGPDAANFAKALLANKAASTPSAQYGPLVDQYIQALTRGGMPSATNAIYPLIQPIVRDVVSPGQQPMQ